MLEVPFRTVKDRIVRPIPHFHKFLIFIEKAAGVDIRCLAAELLDGNDGAEGSKDYEEIIKRVTASAYTGESII